MEAVLFILVFWVAPIVVGHNIGKRKGREGWLWAVLLGWLGVLILALLSDKSGGGDAPAHPQVTAPAQSWQGESTLGKKKCPQCAELVQAEARVCRYCSHRIDEVPATPHP